MQTSTRPVAVVYALLAALSVVLIDLRIVLIPAAIASIGLAIAGFIVFRRLSGALSIPWPAASSDQGPQGFVVIEGKPLASAGYDQELIVAVRVRHLIELLASVALCGAALWFMLAEPNISDGGRRFDVFEIEIICGSGLAILLATLRWFEERRILKRSNYTVGILLSRDPGFFRRGITYQFWDVNRERRGGRGPLWGRGNDNAVLVLYDPKDPDNSATHGAFLFHQFDVLLIPARNRQQVAANS